MNILDYIDWRGDLPFRFREFNEVDNLIFSTLAYVDFDRTGMPREGITLADLYSIYHSAGIDQSRQVCNPGPLLEKAAASERFRNVLVKRSVNIIDTGAQVQFCAVIFVYEPKKIYVAFRGTDNTLVGWREDCNFSYLENTPGQLKATQYVNLIADRENGELILGGHSKGGNFAIYAAAFCREDVRRKRIRKIYSNDGPGFNSHVTEAEGYHAILDKVEKIIPESSLVGILLSGQEKPKIITSSAKGLGQHNPYTWNVVGTGFELADDRSFSSVLMDQTLDKWLSSISRESLERLINTFFDTLESSGIHSLREINNQKLQVSAAFFKAIAESDTDSRGDLLNSIKKLLLIGRDTVASAVASEARKTIQTFTAEQIAKKEANAVEQIPMKEKDAAEQIAKKESDAAEQIAMKKADAAEQIPQIATKKENAAEQLPRKDENPVKKIIKKREKSEKQTAKKEKNVSEKVSKKEKNVSEKVSKKVKTVSGKVSKKEKNASEKVSKKD